MNRPSRIPWGWIASVPAAVLVEVLVGSRLSLGGIQPALSVLALAHLGYRGGSLVATWTGFVCGLLVDVYSPGPLGAQALAGTWVGYFAGLFHMRLVRMNWVVALSVLAMLVILHDAVWHYSQDPPALSLGPWLLTHAVPTALFTVVVALVGLLLGAWRARR